MTLKAEKKEHREHQNALKPLLKHLKEDEIKLLKKGSPMSHKKKPHSKMKMAEKKYEMHEMKESKKMEKKEHKKK